MLVSSPGEPTAEPSTTCTSRLAVCYPTGKELALASCLVPRLPSGGHLGTLREWGPRCRGCLGHEEGGLTAHVGLSMLSSRLEKSTHATSGETGGFMGETLIMGIKMFTLQRLS